ncbi:MAG TPA: homocysteine S-methyltransferase family protein [Acidimicrobiales bacterium]
MYRDRLPQLDGGLFLTDSGLETALIFLEGVELPLFAAFVLLDTEEGTERLRRYFQRHAAIAEEAGAGFVAEAATWRANPDWAAQLGYDSAALDRVNRQAIQLLVELREGFEGGPFVISGCVGPRGDGYSPETLMTPEEAERYHAEQVGTFADTEADMVTAMTMTHTGEAIGVVRAAAAAGIPVVIGITVETDGRLPSGETLAEAVTTVDDATGSAPAYYMVNCAHPTHFEDVLAVDEPWVGRIRSIRANASRRSHAELDEAEDLDDGDPDELGAEYARLRAAHPGLAVLGGCCGTDVRHVAAISAACALPT